jgi:hypothetical protein
MLQPMGKLIAVAVGATQKSASISYDIKKFVEHVDFVNLMAYKKSDVLSDLIIGLSSYL